MSSRDVRRDAGVLGVGELVDAREAVAQDHDGAVGIVVVERAVGAQHLVRDQRLGLVLALLGDRAGASAGRRSG